MRTVPPYRSSPTPSRSRRRAWSTTASGIVKANTTVDVAFEVREKSSRSAPMRDNPCAPARPSHRSIPTAFGFAVDQATAQAERSAGDRDRNRPLLAAGSIAPADMDHLESGARKTPPPPISRRSDSPTRDSLRRSRESSRAERSKSARRLRRANRYSRRRARSGARSRRRARRRRRAHHRRRGGDGAHSGARHQLRRTRVADRRLRRSRDAQLHVEISVRIRRAGCAREWSPKRRSRHARRRSAMMVPAAAVLHDGGVNGATHRLCARSATPHACIRAA